MQQDLLIKLHTALYGVSPLTSDRDRIMEDIGETIMLGALEQILDSMQEESRVGVVALLNENKLQGALLMCKTQGVDVDAVIRDVATHVMDEVMNQTAQ